MTIRKNTNPRDMDLQPELRDILMRNGMQAHVVSNGTAYQLIVQGHDSPMLTYNLTQKQMLALTDWGTNTANKKAYNVFTSIVGNNFYMPKDFVHARNANGRVAMGLHGYRIGMGEYGRERLGLPFPFLGWTPRNQMGYHLRRVGGELFYPQSPMVAERWDKRMKPGELQSGGYGFYYKGNQHIAQGGAEVKQPDVIQDLKNIIPPIVTRPRSEEPAKAYKDLISSPVYFSNEKWEECLASHGVIIDREAKTLTIQSQQVNADMVYDLSDSEIKTLSSNSIKEHSIEERLGIVNSVIKDDFSDRLDMNMLNSTNRIDLALHPQIYQEIEQRLSDERNYSLPVQDEFMGQENVLDDRIYENATWIDGKDLANINPDKGWYREDNHGREVQVDEILVHPTEVKDTYKMTAVINGEAISHEISKKQYDKFLAVDDYHRMKLFSKVFNEVDMKTNPEARSNIGARIFAALTAGTAVTAGVIHGLSHQGPDIYCEHYTGPRPYFKPGVDSPRDVAARVFEAEMNKEISDIRMGR